jgi:hypothetical protein
LIDAEADVNAQFSSDGTQFTVADRVAAYGEPELMQQLIDAGLVFRRAPKGGPLIFAARLGSQKMYEFLLNAAVWPREAVEMAKRELALKGEGQLGRMRDFL